MTATAERSMRVGAVLRGLSFFLVVLCVVGALHLYIGSRLFQNAEWDAAGRAVAWSVLALFFISVPVGLVSTRILPKAWSLPLIWLAHFWIGAFWLLLVLVTASDLALWLLGDSFLRPWQAAFVVAALLPLLVLGFLQARGMPKVVRVQVEIPTLPAPFEGFRIVQISDVHIGETLGRRFLQRVVQRVNSLQADAIAVTGDLVDGSVEALRDEVAPLGDLRAKDGVYFVTGNHEYYQGGRAWEREVSRLGLTVLHNEHRLLQRGTDTLAIGGITDHDAGRFYPADAPNVRAAFEGAPVEAPRILLAHQPRSARLAADSNVALQLSGHTHGGQIFPWMFLVRLQQPTVRGLSKVEGTTVYTSRGTGYWGPPFRIGAPPEITEVVLVRSSSQRGR